MNKKVFILTGVILLVAVGIWIGFRSQKKVDLTTEPSDKIFRSSVYGFTFRYPNDYIVDSDPTRESRFFMFPEAVRSDEAVPLQSIIIAINKNEEKLSPLDWLKTGNSSYDLANGYEVGKVGGQDAIFINDGDWTLFNNPSGELIFSVSFIVAEGVEPPRSAMLAMLRTFSFGNKPFLYDPK